MAVPSVIASRKDTATRANVTPRFRNSAPLLASVIIACSTSGGGGSLALPMSSDAIHQVAMNTATDNRRIASASRHGVIKRARIKLRCRPDEVAAADFGEDAIENACVLLFFGNGAARDSFAVAVAIGAQCGGVGGAGQGLNPVPFRVRG